ncbi:Proteasome subunit beta type-5 [Gurleya vavrai]
MILNIKKPTYEIQDAILDSEIINKYIFPIKGTTTLAFKFKHGMIIAVDSRATAGPYIASQTVNKVIEINPFLLGTMAGGAADCLYWEKIMGIHAKRYQLENNKRITASAASMYLSNCIYRYRGQGLSMGTMVCGWDQKGPGLYYVDNDGTRIDGNLFSVGSGSTIAYGILETEYKFDLEKEEAIELGKKSIFYAGHVDAFSGGIVRVFFMDENGWEKIDDFDFKDLADNYLKKD